MEKNKCVMCNDMAVSSAPANYKEGIVNEPLCLNCSIVDKQIRREKEN